MGAYGPSSVTPHKNVLLPVELWDADTVYTELSVVFSSGSLWVAAADNDNSAPSRSNSDWTEVVAGTHLAAGVTTVTETFTLTPAQIRTLNSIPIDLVVPANANTFIAPGACVFVGSQGSGAYSAAVQPLLQYADASLAITIEKTGAWDGSASAFSVTPDTLVDYDPDAQDWLAQLGLSVQVTDSADVTVGDAPATIILTYTAYDLTGLL